MNTVNKYLKNTRTDYTNALTMTGLFLFSPVIGYTIMYFQESHFLLYFSPFLCTVILFFFLIRPAYKIIRKNAQWWEMNTIKFAPFGIGLLCIYWPPYQRMARKLVSDEFIQVCENALDNLRRTQSRSYFEIEWQHFGKWFSKIESSTENSELRHTLIYDVLLTRIKCATREATEELRMKLLSILKTKAYKEMELADFIRVEMEDAILGKDEYTEADVTQKALENELSKRTSWLKKLLENLTESNIDLTFKEMYKIKT